MKEQVKFTEQTVKFPEGYDFFGYEQYDSDEYFDVTKVVFRKKKQTVKDFDWYVEQYLTNKNGSTIDTITNLIKDHILESVRNLIKEKNYSLVPWEIKIGLFKFICDDMKVNYKAPLSTNRPIVVDNHIILTQEFMDSITK